MNNDRHPLQPGQESVWDYPRPQRLELFKGVIRIEFNGIAIAQTSRAWRVLETSHPPTYYIPQSDIQMQLLFPERRHTFCEFKGEANYWTVRVNAREAQNAAWSYANPNRGYTAIQNHLAFYASMMDACYVNDERAKAQQGDFYGGWITANIVGPFKGGPGTTGW